MEIVMNRSKTVVILLGTQGKKMEARPENRCTPESHMHAAKNILGGGAADTHFISLQDSWRPPRLPPPHAHHSLRWVRRRADGHHRERVQLTQLSNVSRCPLHFVPPTTTTSWVAGGIIWKTKNNSTSTRDPRVSAVGGAPYLSRGNVSWLSYLGGTFLTAQLRMPFFTSTSEQRAMECSVSRWQRWECLYKGSFLVTVPTSLRPCGEGMCGPHWFFPSGPVWV